MADASTPADAFEADLARELLAARARRETVRPPTQRTGEFDLDRAYRVGAALDRSLRQRGHGLLGCKVGFTNRTIWPRFGIDEPILAPIYARTLRLARPVAEVSLAKFCAPMLEVEVVFGIEPEGDAPSGGRPSWMALGFEIVDCHYPDWHLTPADSVADFGLHGALVVGGPVNRDVPDFDGRVARLDRLEVRLLRNETLVARGRGSDVLGHPLEALEVVPRLWPRFDDGGIPEHGLVVSTGTMTPLEPLSPREAWRVEAKGEDLPGPEIVLTD
ncbi:MAG: hydratase [Gemmatimonadales bacterium]|nr:hydratase [Gemmatimonadales bacterium]